MIFLMRRMLALLLLVTIAFGVGRLWYLAKGGYSANRTIHSLPNGISDTPKELSTILNQPFRYLGHGRQCYAFVSADGRTVLKIPRFDCYLLPFRWKLLPGFDKVKSAIFEERQERLHFLMQSFQIAYEDLQEETGLLYLHFHQTDNLPKQFALIDKLGRSRLIDLNRTAFILQERHPLLMPALVEAIKAKDRKSANALLRAFFDLVQTRAKLGIFDKDSSFLKNFAWDGSHGVQIDIGCFYRKPDLPLKTVQRLSLLEGTDPFRKWLASIDRESAQIFNEWLEEK